MDQHKRTSEELNELLKKANNEFHMYYRKTNEITIDFLLQPEEAIQIAKEYHKREKMEGVVNINLDSILFDEAYTFKINNNEDDIRSVWRIQVDLPPNDFLMEDYTLIVSDKDKKVLGVIDPNGHPIFEVNDFTDEDIKYITNDGSV
ncbi:MAG: hypothetical protein ACTIDE_02070 [Carnobacterium maltaromaticum]